MLDSDASPGHTHDDDEAIAEEVAWVVERFEHICRLVRGTKDARTAASYIVAAGPDLRNARLHLAAFLAAPPDRH